MDKKKEMVDAAVTLRIYTEHQTDNNPVSTVRIRQKLKI